jgi:ribose 5-phosphate isomerase A
MSGNPTDRDRLKRAAAVRALDEIEDGMVLGLGTGSTAAFVVEGLAARVKAGLRVVGVPTSERTAAQARALGIPLATFGEHQKLDLTIDGADEVATGSLDLIKGLGGALLREKIVAAASARLVIVVDDEKIVDRLGRHTPVPVEVVQFGWQATAAALAKLGCVPVRRGSDDAPYVTDGGNFILDCRFGPIADPARLERQLAMTVGAVESGLFVGRSSAVIVAGAGGVDILTPPAEVLTGGDAAAPPRERS